MLSQAESECKLALQGDPGMPEAHYYLGMIYKDQGKYADSVNEFNDAIKNDPRYSEAYSGRGLAQLKMNDVTSAMESFKKACGLLGYLAKILLNSASAASSLNCFAYDMPRPTAAV